MIWPFKKKETKEPVIPEFKGVKFGKLYYVPQKDITTYEVALLLPLFITTYLTADRIPYIEKHNLQKHFKENIDE